MSEVQNGIQELRLLSQPGCLRTGNAKAGSADFIQHDGNANHKETRPVKKPSAFEAICGVMYAPEKQRQRMVNQVDKQRSINEISDATGFKIQQTMAKGEHHVNHRPISIVITLSVSYIHAPLP